MFVLDVATLGGSAFERRLAAALVEEAAEAVGVQANRIAGNAFRDEIATALRNAGREAETEVCKWTPFGKRFIDIEVSKAGEVLGGIETKPGASRYTPSQRAKDEHLWRVMKYLEDLVRGP